MKVEVLSADGTKELGIGDYTEDVPTLVMGRMMNVPKIVMPDGSVLMGYECWWQPVEQEGHQ